MTIQYDAIIIGGGGRAGLKPPGFDKLNPAAQCMEAISTGSMQRLRAVERVG